MQRYNVVKPLGDGAFGEVYLAVDKKTQEKVAIKRIKKRFARFEDALALREVKSLRAIPKHPNIVRLRQLIHESEYVHFVFELCTSNLFKMATEGSVKFDEALVKQVMYQLLYGLAHMHKHGFMHRDLKPENLLTTGHPTTGDFTVKLADFGLARELRARPPYTEYVSTRWYRAPEVLLRFTSYSSPIDTFGAGMIMGELLAGQPLAPGTSEVNQMYLLCDLLGTPSQSAWPEGYRQAEKCGFRWPTTSSTGGALSDGKLTTVCPGISPTGLQFLTSLLAFNPAKRPTPAAALGHEWFADLPPDTLGMGVAVSGKARPHADPDIDLQRLTDLHSSASAAEFTAALDALLVDMPSPGKPSEPAAAATPAAAAAAAAVAEQPRAAAEGGSGVQGGQGGSPGSGVDLEGSLSIEALLEQLAP